MFIELHMSIESHDEICVPVLFNIENIVCVMGNNILVKSDRTEKIRCVESYEEIKELIRNALAEVSGTGEQAERALAERSKP